MKSFSLWLISMLILSLNSYSLTATIKGRVTYANSSSSPMAGINVNLEDLEGNIIASMKTSVYGYYAFDVTAEGNYRIRVTSINAPSGVNSVDALLIVKKYAGMVQLDAMHLQAADVVQNSYINATDAMMVQKLTTGNIASFPDGNWIFDNPTVYVAASGDIVLNVNGICRGDVDGSFSPPTAIGIPCPNLPFVVYGGQLYNTVQIGTQCWMRENLNIGTFVQSTSTGVTHSNMSNNATIEKYCYNNIPSNCELYGGLYDWNELMKYTSTSGTQGICPAGWHVPTDQEWCTLTTYVDATVNCGQTNVMMGTTAGSKLKESGTAYWVAPNAGATNETGFTMIGSGERVSSGGFAGFGVYTVTWTSTYPGSNQPYYWYMRSDSPKVNHYNHSFKENGWPIRCIRN